MQRFYVPGFDILRPFALAIMTAILLLSGLTTSAGAQDLNCADFASHDEAQAYFESGGGSPSYNFNGLDRDHDGIACETLPSGGGIPDISAPVDTTEETAPPAQPSSEESSVPVNTTEDESVPAGTTDESSSSAAAGSVGETTQSTTNATGQQNPACSSYDAWEWAQSVFESDPKQYDALDPDNDGTACTELPHGGFAPAFWTDAIPKDAEKVQLVRIVDGDTFEVLIDGVSNRVRIYRADTPETQNEHQCGGPEATNFATFALSFNDEPGTVYLERDKNTRDKYGRELAYVWFTVDGKPYMLNHILINNGWAEDVDYGDRKYDEQFKDAAAFAKRHDLGVWDLCGDFGLPTAAAPTAAPAVPAPAQTSDNVGASAPQEPPAAPASAAPGCDPNYTPCVPNVSYDLNCPDIGFAVTVIGGDPHGFDRDSDGRGCESYG